MLGTLHAEGFLTPHWQPFLGHELNDNTLTSFLQERKQKTSYEIDGIVIDVNRAEKRKELNPTRDTLNPAYSIKYKVADASNQAIATVIEVEWNASKHGYLKPRVRIEPVDLVGVTVQHATGFNARFINENGIGPGAKVRITRSGDVIPFIQDTIESVTPQMPEGEWQWNDTKVDIVLLENTRDVVIEQIVDFFMSIDAPHLRKGSVISLYEKGFTTTESIIKMTEQQLIDIIGENGKKIYVGIRSKLNRVPISVLMGSTNFFGRGVGKRKMKSLIKHIGEDVFTASAEQIVEAEGFDTKTAEKIMNGMAPFIEWLTPLENYGYITIDRSEFEPPEIINSNVSGKNFVFTGFRSKSLQAEIEKQGGDMKGTVSSNTDFVVTTNVNSTSSKIKKARDLNIQIITPKELEPLLGI